MDLQADHAAQKLLGPLKPPAQGAEIRTRTTTVDCGWDDCQAAPAMDTPLCKRHLIKAWSIVTATARTAFGGDFDMVEVAQRGPRGTRGPRRTLPNSVVYYVRLATGDIKIGYTTDLPARRAVLRAPWQHVLAVEPGGPERETERHAQFAATRRSRPKEDFAPSPALLRHIDDVREQWGDPREFAARIRESALAG